jgi:hypothetical protein
MLPWQIAIEDAPNWAPATQRLTWRQLTDAQQPYASYARS